MTGNRSKIFKSQTLQKNHDIEQCLAGVATVRTLSIKLNGLLHIKYFKTQ